MTIETPRPQPFRPDQSCPLDGLRVLDFSRLVAGNMLTLQLADFGAEVIKLEPDKGDPLRHWREDGVPATPEMRVAVPRRLEATPLTRVGPYPVVGVSHLDGTKILLEDDNWALLRFSGTEPVLRMTAEADTEAKAQEILDWLRGFATAGA